jgi:hypothetical protein
MKPPEPVGAFPGWPAGVLAHQGGWDEVLLVLAPLAVVGLLLWVANRRVVAQLEDGPESDGADGSPSDHSDST